MLLAMAENAFKTARQEAGLTQVEVAQALGVEQAAVSKWERGRALPETRNLVQLAVLYRRTVDPLVKGISDEYDRLQRALSGDKSGTDGTKGTPSPVGNAKAQILLRRYEREQARVAATGEKLGRKVGEIGLQLGELASLLEQLPGGPNAVARRQRSKGPSHRRRRRRRDDSRRPPEAPPG